MKILLGIDRILKDGKLRRALTNRRLALLSHPAAMTGRFEHSLDALADCPGLEIACAFGPQHGMRGEKQDNMIASEDYADPVHGIPVFSLYGDTRRPTEALLDRFDVLIVDIQDLGTRVYTFLTTLGYFLEAAAKAKKAVWVLDRPNPAGRPVEGTLLRPGWESFVGLGPIPMRHGLTLGEAALWYKARAQLDFELNIVTMEGYDPARGPGYGWPMNDLPWVNPSPNASGPGMARCYPGTVLLEGTTLSEGRGTTHPLEVAGAPGLDARRLIATLRRLAPSWLRGCLLRPCHFEPIFHKHAGKLCAGFQIHVDGPHYRHAAFRPYRLMALCLKALRLEEPEFALWRDFPYEYETERLAVDVIAGGPALREWVDDGDASPADLEALLAPDERAWREERREFLLY